MASLEHSIPSVINLQPPAKRAKRIKQDVSWNYCLIHRDNIKCGAIETWSTISWTRFCEAATRRQDDIYEYLKEYIDGSSLLPKSLKELYKHHNCYATYVLPKAVELAEASRRRGNPQLPTTLCSSGSATDSCSFNSETVTTRSASNVSYIHKCIICQNDKRQRIKRWLLEEPRALTLYKSAETLLQAATLRCDERLLRDIGGGARGGRDLIAGDILIHDSCRRQYVSQRNIYHSDATSSEESYYEKAFIQIAEEVKQRVIDGKDVLHLSDLRDELINILHTQYGIHTPNYRNQSLMKRLQERFGQKICFWYPNKWRQMSELVFSNEVPSGMIVEVGLPAAHTEEEDEEESIEISDMEVDKVCAVYHTALDIRSDLQNVLDLPWPPRPQDINDDNIHIPTTLFNILAWIIHGDRQMESQITLAQKVVVPTSVEQKINSIGQDILYCTRNGYIRTPKHVSLAVAAHHMTGSMEIVSMLNQFGHCISKTKLQEIETAVAEIHVSQQGEPIVPSNMSPNVPAVFGWDNFDTLEETVTGKGTTHHTNGIMVQPVISTCQPLATAEQTICHHRRSLKPEHDELNGYQVPRRPEPPRYNDVVEVITSLNRQICQKSKELDFIWFLTRLDPNLLTCEYDTEGTSQIVPGWVGFNAIIRQDVVFPLPHNVGYCPTICEPPTRMDVIYTFLRRSVDITDCNNGDVPGTGVCSVQVEVDLGIWMKAMEVKFGMKDDQRMNRLVLRQGSLHMGMAFLSIPAIRYGSAGLKDLFIEADVVAAGSVNKVFEGQHWNRGVRAHKIGAEAMERLRWKHFLIWLADNGKLLGADLTKAIQQLRSNVHPDQLLALQGCIEFQNTQEAFAEYIDSRHGMQRFWSDYIELIHLLLRFIRSAREGDWSLHIECLKEMLVWFWAYDRINYARYLPVYLVMIAKLPTEHPDAHIQLTEGDLFTIQRSTYNSFGRIPLDQTVETTINRDCKTKGGIIGLSCNVAASFKWSLLRADRADYTKRCRLLSGQVVSLESDYVAKDAGRKRVQKEEQLVQRVMETVCNWRNPFEGDETLCHLATGKEATAEVVSDLLGAHEKGMVALTVFAQDRLESNGKHNFYSPIHKLSLKTFATMSVSQQKTSMKKESVIKSSRDLFARLYLIGQARHVDSAELMMYPLGTLPLAIANSDGSMAKTMKSNLLRKLEKHDAHQEEEDQNVPPDQVAYIYDAMAILHTLTPSENMTYSDIALMILKQLLKNVALESRIDLVSDTYKQISIKNPERDSREQRTQNVGHHNTTICNGNQRVDRQYKASLYSATFKQSLIAFLVEEWQKPCYINYIGRHALYITNGDKCFKLTSDGTNTSCVNIPDLSSNQEEADGRLLLHVADADQAGCQKIVIQSPDTDVAILGISHCGIGAIGAKLLFLTGTQHRKRYANLSNISKELGIDVSNALIGVHAFSGCDTVSAFAGHGKTSILKLTKSNETLCEAMQLLGCSFDVSDRLITKCESSVCIIYGYPAETSVNRVRHLMFGNTTTDPSRIPPCRDVLIQHVKRANYQAALWRNCLHAQLVIPSPHNNGWEVNQERILIQWMTLKPAPQAILAFIRCGCQKTCDSRSRCSCQKHNLACTSLCKCDKNKCLNQHDNDSEDSDNSDIE